MPTAMSYFAVGSSVVLQNLVNASKYNGLRGTVQSVIDTKSLRQNVLVNGVHLSVKPANMKMFNDDVMAMSIKELVAELKDYNIPTDTIKDKQSLQEAVIAARKDGWIRPSTKVTASKSPPPSPPAAEEVTVSVLLVDGANVVVSDFTVGRSVGTLVTITSSVSTAVGAYVGTYVGVLSTHGGCASIWCGRLMTTDAMPTSW